ncbi:TPA: YqaJ viral recombinase family protein [Pseudomonas aeruginosa]|nr:YqaJ viral recombinase family protein [Pseudomonas aeruginosa]HBP4578260.1 YqaJ viral recombinase family protein [Pseudomonas aeruginosa]HCT6664983.1 YqaJ viral recombinase family protein [Pseudomonas aeruginosa]HEK3672390.1 YqaJ viral recombinase family protein [Pseudomonas aeruginosa]
MRWHDVPQNSDVWEALRIGKATASSFGTFMANEGKAFGEPAKKYALQIALERATGVKASFSFSNDHTERGHEQEPVARMLYEDENFVEVSNGGFFDWELYGDSPDGLVMEDGVVEIKSVTAAVHYATMRRESFDPAYRWQLIGHLDCTGRAWVDFISYCSEFPPASQLIVHRLHRSECADEIQRLRDRREAFLELVEQTYQTIPR